MTNTPNQRRGPRIGWVGGFIGGTFWMILAALVLLVKGDLVGGLVMAAAYGLCLLGLKIGLPWRRPDTTLWKLYLLVLAPMAAGGAFFFLRFHYRLHPLDNQYWLPLLIVPFLIPLLTMGQKTWRQLHGPLEEEDQNG